MKKGLKVTLIVAGVLIGLPALAFLGLMGYAVVQITFFSLPTDGPRVVSTANWEFQAPEGWFTQCASEAPNCIAVALDPQVPSWDQRREWIEIQPVDATGVTDSASLGERARQVGQELVQGRMDADLQSPDPAHVFFDGVNTYTVVNMAANDYWRTLFAQLPDGSILRFTCHARDYTHDEACANGLGAVGFPAARVAFEQQQAAEAARVAAEEEAKRVAAERRMQDQVARAAEQRQVKAQQAAKPATGEDFLKALDDLEKAYQDTKKRYEARRDDSMDNYRGPGWYVVRRLAMDESAYKGPYSAESSCIAEKPADDADGWLSFKCMYLAPP